MYTWILIQQGWFLYIALAMLLIGGSFGLPIPEDIPLILTGVLISQQKLHAGLAFVVVYLAILIGDLVIYFVGQTWGHQLLKSRMVQSRLRPKLIARISSRLERHAISVIFLARHLFYLRTVTFLLCGTFRMNIWRFICIDAIAGLMSTAVMISLGYFASENFASAFELINRIKAWSVFLGVAVIFAAFLGLYLWQRKSSYPE